MITQLGYQRLLRRLEELNQELARVSEERGRAAAEGDLKENSAYIFLGERAEVLRSQTRTVKDDIAQSVVTPLPTQTQTIEFGHQLKIKFVEINLEMNITLVGKNDTGLKPDWISIDSPLGIALLDHCVGDFVSVNDQQVEIQHISLGDIS